MAGALGLIFSLPELHPRLARARGFVAAVIIIIAAVLTTGTWVGAAPQLQRIPLQLVLLGVIWLALAGVGKLRMPRWSLPASAAVLTVGCTILVFNMKAAHPFGIFVAIFGITTLLMCAGTIVAWIVARRGSRRDGDIAMAIFASYAIGQCIPHFF